MERNLKYKGWLVGTAFIFLALVLITAGINLIIDPYGVFQTRPVDNFNRNKAKFLFDGMTKFYALKTVKPSSLMIGTSRMEYLDPKDLEKYTGSKTYNLGITGANIYEQYVYLRYAVEHYNIRSIVVGLDWEAFFSGEPRPVFEKERLDDSFYLRDYVDALFSMDTLRNSFLTARANIEKEPAVIDFGTGMTVAKAFYQQLHDKGTSIIKDRVKITMGDKVDQYRKVSESRGGQQALKNVEYLRRMIELARERKIEVKVFLSPIYAANYDLIYGMNLGDAFENWKQEVAKVTDYYDFSGYNSVTRDISWWIDCNHIQSKGGTVIFARLFDDMGKFPPDFGVFVTQATVKRHLEALRKQIKASPSQLPPLWEGRWADNWMGRKAQCFLSNFAGGEVVFNGYVTQYALPLSLVVSSDITTKKITFDKPGPFSVSIRAPAGKGQMTRVELSVDNTFNPKSLGQSEDGRDLGVRLTMKGEEDGKQ